MISLTPGEVFTLLVLLGELRRQVDEIRRRLR